MPPKALESSEILTVGLLKDEGFDELGDFVLLAPGEFGGRFKGLLQLPAGPVPRWRVLPWVSPTNSSTEMFRVNGCLKAGLANFRLGWRVIFVISETFRDLIFGCSCETVFGSCPTLPINPVTHARSAD